MPPDKQIFFVPKQSVPLYLIAYSVVRNLYTSFSPLWSFRAGAWNPQADVEGPFYLVSPPRRDIESGKAVFASKELIDEYGAFLLTGKVIGADGAPLAGATIDMWQADTKGNYYCFTYNLRGTVTTDRNGAFEILTVPCCRYGFSTNVSRPSHFHIKVYPPQGDKTDSQPFTTQQYLCPNNDVRDLENDMTKYIMHENRPVNMLKAWAVPDSSGKTFQELPPLQDNAEAQAKKDDWNKRIADAGSSAKVISGAHCELRLNSVKGWF